MAAVMRLLRGEDLDRVSRDVRVTAATLSEWRDEFLAAGESGLKTRKRTPQDDQIMKLKAMIGELTMKNELLQEGLRLSKLPLAQRRSRQ
jgi:transposase